jgi:predicted permease
MEMLNLQLQIFALMLVGYILGKRKLIDKPGRKQLNNLVMNLVLPAAIIRSFQIELTKEILVSTFMVLILSVCIQFVLIVIINRFLWNWISDSKQKINLQYSTAINNAGAMGMVVSQAAFGQEGMLYASIFMIPVRIMMWSYGVKLYDSKASGKGSLKRVFTHPCVVAIFIGIACMLYQSLGGVFPVFVQSTLNAIANCNTALIMIVIGAILAEVPLASIIDKLSLLYSLIRLVLIPLAVFLICSLLPISSLAIKVCILETAMPAPSTMAMLAQKYEQDEGFASRLICVSTAFSLITLPIWTFLLNLI